MSLADRYQSYGGLCCLHLQGTKSWRLSVKGRVVTTFSSLVPVLLST